MKKSDFSEPRRQSLVAILLIIYKTYQTIVKQLWPFLIIFVFGGNNRRGWLMWLILALSILGMITSIWKYFKYYFYIEQDELIVERGILNKKRLSVPFDRIQTINFQQNIIHRIFGVVELKIDTAGTHTEEFVFNALDQQIAEDLRKVILKNKSKTAPTEYKEVSTEIVAETDGIPIMTMDLADLIKAGLVQNHFKSGWLIIAAIIWIWQNLRDTGFQDQFENQIQGFLSGILTFVFIGGIFVLLSLVVSLARMIINNYNLQFIRTQNGFKVHAGLFTRKVTSAMDNKIQMITWADNPLKKLIGIKDLLLMQASSKEVTSQKSIKIPGLNKNHIDLVIDTLYGDISNIRNYRPVHSLYFSRMVLYLSLVVIPVIIILLSTEHYLQASIASMIYIYMIFSRYLKYKKLRYGYDQRILHIKGGAFGDKTTLIPIYKIQGITTSTSPHQRRKDLTTVTIHSASGNANIPYIPIKEAHELKNILLYLIETSKKVWM